MQPHKAVPLFSDKFLAITRLVLSKLESPDTTPLLLYILSRDLSIFSLDFFTGDRSAELGRSKSKEIFIFADSSGLLFNHTFGKTLREKSFSVKRSGNSDIVQCAILLFLSICRFPINRLLVLQFVIALNSILKTFVWMTEKPFPAFAPDAQSP